MLKKFFSAIVFMCVLMFGVNVDAKKISPPVLTAEFDQMDFAPLYPTYSWEPLPMTHFYQVQVIKLELAQDKIVRELMNGEALNRVTDSTPFTQPGKYLWHVRVVDKNKRPLSDWSEEKFFTVTAPVTFAVLGDSLSHGGAAYIPAGQLSCQWETYCDVPIKNLARSGDKTQMMIDRFDNDVLPFAPKVLLIMAGVNDIRAGSTSETVIKNLETLRDKCLANDITPVFCTLSSMNPDKMNLRGIPFTDGDWREAREKINLWIMSTPYFVDVASPLIDGEGYLRSELTPDGLHPALRGKKIMGERVAKYLRATFANLCN